MKFSQYWLIILSTLSFAFSAELWARSHSYPPLSELDQGYFGVRAAWNNAEKETGDENFIKCALNFHQLSSARAPWHSSVAEVQKQYMKAATDVRNQLVNYSSSSENSLADKGKTGDACYGSFENLEKYLVEEKAAIHSSIDKLRAFDGQINNLAKGANEGVKIPVTSKDKFCSKMVADWWKRGGEDLSSGDTSVFVNKQPANGTGVKRYHEKLLQILQGKIEYLDNYQSKIDSLKAKCGEATTSTSKSTSLNK